MKPVRTLVLIVDDRAARFLVNDGVGKGLREVASLDARDFPDAAGPAPGEIYRSAHGPTGQVRHGIDPRSTIEEQARLAFVGHVVAALDSRWTAEVPDRLVLAAPAKVLGLLRRRLAGAPARAVHAELSKDLVGLPLRDLAPHFAQVLAL
jgi:protein required for attachment to host cells